MNTKKYHLAETEAKFAELIWQHEPISSPELVKLCEQELSWKKSTTYTVLKKLCERGIFRNDNTIVSSIIKKEQFYEGLSRQYVEESFSGSLPLFLTAFFGGKKLTAAEAEELKSYIDAYTEPEKRK